MSPAEDTYPHLSRGNAQAKARRPEERVSTLTVTSRIQNGCSLDLQTSLNLKRQETGIAKERERRLHPTPVRILTKLPWSSGAGLGETGFQANYSINWLPCR